MFMNVRFDPRDMESGAGGAFGGDALLKYREAEASKTRLRL